MSLIRYDPELIDLDPGQQKQKAEIDNFVAVLNARRCRPYLAACRDWRLNVGLGTGPHPFPEPPLAMETVFNTETGEFVEREAEEFVAPRLVTWLKNADGFAIAMVWTKKD